MSTQYHIAASGKNAGKLVPCYATNCRIGNVSLTSPSSILNLDEASIPTHKIDFYSLAEEYAKSNNTAQHIALASDRRTPSRLLAELAENAKDERSLYLVANNPNTPSEVLRKLMSEEYDIYVHQGIAENWNCPPELLDELENYKNDSIVREKAMLTKWAHTNPEKPVSIALNPNSSPEELDTIKDTPVGLDENVPFMVAKHPNVSTETLRYLSSNLVGGIYGAASNPKTPKNILKKLSKNEDHSIRTSVYFNPAFNDEERKNIKYYEDPEITRYISPTHYKGLEASRLLSQTEF